MKSNERFPCDEGHVGCGHARGDRDRSDRLRSGSARGDRGGPQQPAKARLAGADHSGDRGRLRYRRDHAPGRGVEAQRVALAGAVHGRRRGGSSARQDPTIAHPSVAAGDHRGDGDQGDRCVARHLDGRAGLLHITRAEGGRRGPQDEQLSPCSAGVSAGEHQGREHEQGYALPHPLTPGRSRAGHYHSPSSKWPA
jgi:hypothetical protein